MVLPASTFLLLGVW